MRHKKKGISLLDVVLMLMLIGIATYMAILQYYRWAESFSAQEAIVQLKKIKHNVEICFISKSKATNINNCILNPRIQNADTAHFKCCEGENNTEESNKISYLLYATRNERGLAVEDEGGEQPACGRESKPRERASSGVVLCRHSDGTESIAGWGIYKGNY